MTLDEYLGAMNFRHFTPDEIMVNMGHDINGEPPRKLWPNIVPTMVVVDELRYQLRRPCHVSSVYRHPAYNRNIRGSSRRSSHQSFSAADCHFRGLSGYDVAPLAKELRGQWFELPAAYLADPRADSGVAPYAPLPIGFRWRGGIGVYPWGVHVDTRGRNATWQP